MNQITAPHRFLRITLLTVLLCNFSYLATAQNANEKPAAAGNKDAQTADAAQSPRSNHNKQTLAELKATALKGDVEAQFTLGALYYVGKEVPRDLSEAAQWFRKAADQGHAESQWWIGRNYETGETDPDAHLGPIGTVQLGEAIERGVGHDGHPHLLAAVVATTLDAYARDHTDSERDRPRRRQSAIQPRHALRRRPGCAAEFR